MKLSSGDRVVIISGKDKGKTGSVLRTLKNGRVVVSDVNMRTKHLKSYPNRPGQIIRYEASIDVSNVMLIDPKTKKRTRIGYRLDEHGKKRIAKRSGEVIVAVRGRTTGQKDVAPEKETAEAKEAKATTSPKETKKKKEQMERVDAPEKAPFWKKMGFGATAMEEEESKEGGRMKENRSVPEQGRTPDTFSHKRGE